MRMINHSFNQKCVVQKINSNINGITLCHSNFYFKIINLFKFKNKILHLIQILEQSFHHYLKLIGEIR